MSLALILQLLVNGIITGIYYAILGVSWSIIYSTTRVFHFAHGLVFTVAAYTAVIFTMNVGLPLVVGSVLAVMMAVLVGCGTDLAIYRPLRRLGASPFVIFTASLGLLILGQNVIQILFTPNFRSLTGFPYSSLFVGPVSFTTVRVLMVVVSVLAIYGLKAYLTRSKFGKAIRAVTCNPDMAEIVGIDKERVSLLVFGLGSAAAALAAVPFTLDTVATPYMGMEPLFIGFIVTFIGGIGSISGAVVGGLLLGVVENLSLLAFSSEWRVVVTFAFLLVGIILRPTGLAAFAK